MLNWAQTFVKLNDSYKVCNFETFSSLRATVDKFAEVAAVDGDELKYKKSIDFNTRNNFVSSDEGDENFNRIVVSTSALVSSVDK